jgi:hypothetical protein
VRCSPRLIEKKNAIENASLNSAAPIKNNNVVEIDKSKKVTVVQEKGKGAIRQKVPQSYPSFLVFPLSSGPVPSPCCAPWRQYNANANANAI